MTQITCISGLKLGFGENRFASLQVLKKDHVAAGLCCIQLFLNSSNQEQALRHLERAKV